MGMERIVLVRHAKAMDREAWELDDLSRPLLPKGHKRAEGLAELLVKRYPSIDAIFASPAIRTKETAQSIARAFPAAPLVLAEEILPDSGIVGYSKLLEQASIKGHKEIVVVGHEPDLSETVSMLCSNGRIHLHWKKAAFVELVMDGEGIWRIEAMIPASFF